MKIWCDVCDKDEAAVFCVADEAALCNACDHRVHHANKLAGKHQRFSLLLPSSSPKQVPLCDICQERRAFLFCQQDRAILCIPCDDSIHKSNEHTKKHNRFLLTGVKISANSSLYSSKSTTETTTTSSSSAIAKAPPTKSSECQNSRINKPIAADQPRILNNPTTGKTTMTTYKDSYGGPDVPTSSISDYLMDMLPAWHVEDFLDPSSYPFGFSKSGGSGNDMMPFWDGDFNTGASVPQATTTTPVQIQSFSSFNMPDFGDQISFKDINKDISSRNWSDDNSFAVPQISPPSAASNKRSRSLW